MPHLDDLLLPRERARPAHPLRWIVEPLMDDPTYLEKAMFGSRGVYVRGQMVFVLSAGDDPDWAGVLVATDETRHAALQREFPALVRHGMLRKWLFLPIAEEHFEDTAIALVARVQHGDPRIGVTPRPRKPRAKKGPIG